MKGTLAMACTEGGLYQHNWREQSSIPALERLFMVRKKTSFLYILHAATLHMSSGPRPHSINDIHIILSLCLKS